MTAAAGLPAYEISNHARPGEESRHNLTYWRYGDLCRHRPRRARPARRHARPSGTGSPRTGSPRSPATATASPRRRAIAPAEQRRRGAADGPAPRRGRRSRRIAALAGCDPVDRASTGSPRQGLLARDGDRLARHARAACCCSTRSWPRSSPDQLKPRGAGETTFVPVAVDLAHLERPLGDAVAAEAEGAVDAGKAARIAQRPRREGAARPASSPRPAPSSSTAS